MMDGQLEDLRISEYDNLKSKIEESDFTFFLAFDVGNADYLQKNDCKFAMIWGLVPQKEKSMNYQYSLKMIKAKKIAWDIFTDVY